MIQANEITIDDVGRQLMEVSYLKDGWHDGNGKAVIPGVLDKMAMVTDSLYSKGLPLPHIYPTIDGGLQAEWSLGKTNEFQLTINPVTHCEVIWSTDSDGGGAGFSSDGAWLDHISGELEAAMNRSGCLNVLCR